MHLKEQMKKERALKLELDDIGMSWYHRFGLLYYKASKASLIVSFTQNNRQRRASGRNQKFVGNFFNSARNAFHPLMFCAYTNKVTRIN